MKNNRIFRTIVLAVSLSLLSMAVMPAKPVLAQSITLSKYFGYLGTEITITGTGFDAYSYGNVNIYFGDIKVKSLKVPETGTFTTSINVPSTVTPGETYLITVEYEGYKTIASKQFIVAKSILEIDPVIGRIDDWVIVDGSRFDTNREIRIYFSSDKANLGDKIDTQVTAYEDMYQALYGVLQTNINGDFKKPYHFEVPSALTHGKDKEDVHDGKYYIYATYSTYKGSELKIEAVAEFTVLGGIIELAPDKGQVGTEVHITGISLRGEQNITVKYDGNIIDIASGNSKTDTEGDFKCTIIIPEGVAGDHQIVVRDESGNMPKATFSLEPKVTVEPTSEMPGNIVRVRGFGFAKKEYLTITLNGKEVATTPTFVQTNSLGSFNANLHIPNDAPIGTSIIAAKDNTLNEAEAQLTISTTPEIEPTAGMNLSPITSLISPGHAGMELVVDGTRFTANTTVTVTLSNGKPVTLAETATDADGNFSVEFTVPPIVAGSYTITASDGSNNMTSVFVMESESPIMPVPLSPKVTSTAEAKTRFDWEGIDDPSGMTYVLQIGTDAAFTNILLEKKGLTNSEYTLTEEEKLESVGGDNPYYWRVKAVDGAFNESDWTPAGQFYVGSSRTSIPAWVLYTLYGLGGLILVFLGFWVIRRRRRIA